MEEIKFYKVNEPFGNFSNFSLHPILIDNEIWPTTEHYFQASKFNDASLRKKIREFKSPMEAVSIGRNISNQLREDWEEIKMKIMYTALSAKFLQHTFLKSELLNTGNKILIEHTINDKFWGDGGDGTGLNRLGCLLMKVREDIKGISDDPNIVFPPWIAFPRVDVDDMFWRMGLGENYLLKWSRFYLNIDDKVRYQTMFKEPPDWANTY